MTTGINCNATRDVFNGLCKPTEIYCCLLQWFLMRGKLLPVKEQREVFEPPHRQHSLAASDL